jgi:hypothetical protein
MRTVAGGVRLIWRSTGAHRTSPGSGSHCRPHRRRRGAGSHARALDVQPSAGPSRGGGGAAVLCRRLRGRPLLRQRLAHHRRDGRGLDPAAEAPRRRVVRHRRSVGRAGDEVHERVGLHALRPPRCGWPEAAAHRLRSRRPARRALRAADDQPRRLGCVHDGEGRRAFRAPRRLPVGLHGRHAQRQRQHPRRRHVHRERAAVHRRRRTAGRARAPLRGAGRRQCHARVGRGGRVGRRVPRPAARPCLRGGRRDVGAERVRRRAVRQGHRR